MRRRDQEAIHRQASIFDIGTHTSRTAPHRTMLWVPRRDYANMPSTRPRRDGWIRVRRSSAWAEIHPHLLLPDPNEHRSGLIRFSKLLANSLYGIHVGADRDSGHTLGSRNLRPNFIYESFEELAALGLPRKPQEDRETIKAACAAIVAKDPPTFTPKERDWEREVETADRAQRRDSFFDNIPYAAPAGSNGCLSEVADVFNYAGNFLDARDRSVNTHTGRIIEFLVGQFEKHDNALAGMNTHSKGRRLLSLMSQAPIPGFLDSHADGIGDSYAAAEARVKWSLGTQEEKQRVVMAHALRLLTDARLPRLQRVLMDGPQPVATNRQAAELMLRMARLIKSSAFEHRHLTLSTYSAVMRLEKLLHKEQGLLERESVQQLTPERRIEMLETKQAMMEASWRGNSTSNQQSTGQSGFPREMTDSLNEQVSTAQALQLEEELSLMMKSATMDEMELCYKITRSRNSIMLKVLLDHIPWLSIRPFYGQIISMVRPVWDKFATLVLVAGVEGWRTANDKQRAFELPKAVLDNIRTKSTQVSIIDDIYAPMAEEVLKAAESTPKGLEQHLSTDYLRSKERQIGDRMFWLLGYKAEAEATIENELADSFVAVIDTTTQFIEDGIPLDGEKKKRHLRLATNFYNRARKEHQQAHELWAESKDPAHRHPNTWLPAKATCKAMIAANNSRLEKLLDILDYAPDIVNGKQTATHPRMRAIQSSTVSHSCVNMNVPTSVGHHFGRELPEGADM